MQGMPGGSMLAVRLSEADVAPYLGASLDIAAVNGPAIVVISGPTPDIVALEQRLIAADVAHRRLSTSHAFHSRMVDPLLERFANDVRGIRLSRPEIPWVSTVTGDWITETEATAEAYWSRHAREKVRFSDALAKLLAAHPNTVLLDVGPGQTLATLAKAPAARATGAVTFASLRHPDDPGDDAPYVLETLGRLWLSGVAVAWQGHRA